MFRLESPEIEQLERTIWTLIQGRLHVAGRPTRSGTLQNLLVAFQRGRRFRPSLCEDALGVSLPGGAGSWTGQANAEVAAILKELLQSSGAGRSLNSPFYPSSSSSSSSSYPRLGQTDEMGGLERDGVVQEKYGDGLYPGQGDSVLYPGQGRLGAVPWAGGRRQATAGRTSWAPTSATSSLQVHKYFDQSKGQLKRDPFPEGRRGPLQLPHRLPAGKPCRSTRTTRPPSRTATASPLPLPCCRPQWSRRRMEGGGG